MKPLVKHGQHMSEINVSPISNDTEVTLKQTHKGVVVIQNDEIVTLLQFAVMHIVRGIREMYPTIKMNVI
jgi:hypothetical protein